MFEVFVKNITSILFTNITIRMNFSIGAERETCSPPLYYSDRSARRIRKGKTKKKTVSVTDLPVQKPDYKLRKNKKKKNHNKIAKLRAARLKPITDELFSTEQHDDQVEPSFKNRIVIQRWLIVKNDDDITPYSCVSSTPETRLLFRLGRGRQRAVKRRLTGQHWIASDHWMNAML